jgi:transposase
MQRLSGFQNGLIAVYARILAAANNSGGSEAMTATSVSVGESTVYRTKRRFVEGSLELALSEEQRPGCGRKLSGKEEALLIATACSSPPEGRARWMSIGVEN